MIFCENSLQKIVFKKYIVIYLLNTNTILQHTHTHTYIHYAHCIKVQYINFIFKLKFKIYFFRCSVGGSKYYIKIHTQLVHKDTLGATQLSCSFLRDNNIHKYVQTLHYHTRIFHQRSMYLIFFTSSFSRYKIYKIL